MSKIYLKKAECNDIDLIYELIKKNDFMIYSLNFEEVRYSEYKCWFEKNMKDVYIESYFCYNDSDIVGQIILNYNDNTAFLNYCIDIKYQKYSYVEALLKLLETEIISTHSDAMSLYCNVKKDDIAYQKFFEESGYNKLTNDVEFEYFRYSKIIDRKTSCAENSIEAENNNGGILLLTNNRNALTLYGKLLKLEESVYFFSDKLNINQVMILKPDLIVSYNYKYIIKEDVISYMQGNIINLHISYLPWNKGSDPNFWSFIDNAPKGITIHKVDKGLDTGQILCQKIVKFDEEYETFRTSYEKLNNEIVTMLIENWENLRSNLIQSIKQEEKGSYHTKSDFIRFTECYPLNWDEYIADYKKRISKDKLG